MIRRFKAYVAAVRRANRVLDAARTPIQELPGGQDAWIEESMHWLLEEFGCDVLLKPVMVPDDLIPADYAGTHEAARLLLGQVCKQMEVPVERIDLRFDLSRIRASLPATAGGREHRPAQFAAGRWTPGEERNTISIKPELVRDPVKLVATFAHELGHELLIGSGRIEGTRADQESLTDLLTVFYGLGVFAANAALDLIPHPSGRGKAVVASGYLREVALAYYCLLRQEPATPPWARYVTWRVRIEMMLRLRELRRLPAARDAN